MARAEAEAARPGREKGERTAAYARARAGLDPHEPQGAAHQGQGPHLRLREPAHPTERKGGRRPGDLHPAGAAPGQAGHRGRGRAQGLRGQATHGQPELLPAAWRHRRHRRPERRRQDHPVPHDHRPGPAGCGHHPHRRDGQAGLCRPVAGCTQPGEDHLRDHQRGPGDHLARHPRGERPRLRGPVQLHRQRPAAEGGRDLRRPAQPRAPGAHAQGRRQRAPPGRADQRPGRQHHARPGRRPGKLCGHRAGHQPRPLVSGPHRHAHHGL